MTPLRWRRVEKVFRAARDLDGPDRAAFLDEACGGDAALRAEVESLLPHGAKSDAFLGVVPAGGKQTISHYRIHQRIGEGGMGLVHQAWDTILERWVAIKFLPPWTVADPASRQRLIDEARHASSLSHPNIVTVYEIGQEGYVSFIVMELISGKTLADLIPSTGLPAQRAISYARGIGDALIRAHRQGLLHRDLKPSNIMVTDEGRVKLLDFGLAAPAESQVNQAPGGQPAGTKDYSAPEQLGSGTVDKRSDIYAFGLVLYEMLTGRHAFRSGRRHSAAEKVLAKPMAGRLTGKLPAALSNAVLRCLEKDPDKRFQSTEDLLTALSAGLNSDNQIKPEVEASVFQEELSAHRSEEVLRARIHMANLSYESVAESRKAAAAVGELLRHSGSAAVRETVCTAAKAILTADESYRKGFIATASRPVRKMAMELLRIAAQDELRAYLQPHDLEHLDLVEMDFSRLDLAGFRFAECFLLSSTFERTNLTGASFAGAAIRNVNFRDAVLIGADFVGADWWNSLGLTEDQLRQSDLDTLARCPISTEAMQEFLAARYAVPFASWDYPVQREIQLAWTEYLRPGGLRDFVNSLKK